MASKKIDRHTLWQRVDQGLTFTKNANHTMASTSGQALTARFFSEANARPILASGVDVTSGSPTGNAADTTITMVLDTLTGITLTEDLWYELTVTSADGTMLIPNAITADRVMVFLRKQPATA